MFNDAMKAIESRAKRFGPMRDANAYAKVRGACNDTAEIWLRIDGGKIRKGSFMTDGCGYSKHCCNKAIELAEGMRPEEAEAMTQAQVLEASGPIPEDHQHCALLAADTIKLAIAHFYNPPEKQTLSQWLKRILKK
ncbi:iron-sulfur cluster assembly scaffold protein [Pontiella sulfatireligans]|uniref:Iron-sulfur cluster assembly scaffold protein IscU n=1 Tax=Pontiella sulfatireligans TaxID=2750658 RepID=A0A6C2USZ8_9BACT|nr:iron-sulfur cluster assembly scaffold protein [Pontiella sulfatireligans]VGO22381.1 Iron-sulfur cluster assembly scaffold protein IscU [Pontiella sulfatireligans]